MSPTLVLAVLAGVAHTALYVLLRGETDRRLPLVLAAAVLGAAAGDALGARLGIGLLAIGDFQLLGASALAWVGIAVVVLVAPLGGVGPRE